MVDSEETATTTSVVPGWSSPSRTSTKAPMPSGEKFGEPLLVRRSQAAGLTRRTPWAVRASWLAAQNSGSVRTPHQAESPVSITAR